MGLCGSSLSKEMLEINMLRVRIFNMENYITELNERIQKLENIINKRELHL